MIDLDKDKKAALVAALQSYAVDDLDIELGQFDAEFLLDFVIKELGPSVYNQALSDAHQLLQSRIESLNEGFEQLEKPEPR